MDSLQLMASVMLLLILERINDNLKENRLAELLTFNDEISTHRVYGHGINLFVL